MARSCRSDYNGCPFWFLNREYAPIVEEMGTACKGTCEQGGECFKVSYNPLYREGISKDRLSALRAQYPDIYDEFVDQTESRIFKVVKSAIA